MPESIKQQVDSLREEFERRINEIQKPRLKAQKRPRRKGIGDRVHKIIVSDVDMLRVYIDWEKLTSHTDNPSMEDAVVLRNMLAKHTKQNLEPLCLFWVRNEMVALRKKGSQHGGVKDARNGQVQ